MTVWDKLEKAFERYRETGESPVMYLDDRAVSHEDMTAYDVAGIAGKVGIGAAIIALGYLLYRKTRKGRK